ncbi:MAG: glycosyltransferase [Cyanobacteriota bacterium]|nr:glycosyltransferase [Cyanobacteriota bacterium]
MAIQEQVTMEVLSFVRRFPCLSQTFVAQQYLGLKELGVSLTILADGGDDHDWVHTDMANRELLPQVRYHHIPASRRQRLLPALRLLALGPPPGLLKRLGLLNPWYGGMEAASLRLLFQAATVSACRPPDLLHAHFGPVGAMVAALRQAGVVEAPLITTFYGYDVSRTPAHTYRYLFQTGDLHLVLSQRMRLRLVDMGAPADKILIHPLGVNPSLFHPRAATLHPTLNILSVARLVPKKGIADGLRAVAAAAVHTPLHYTIIGEGPCRAELEALAASLAIADRVTFLGGRPNREVIDYLHHSDLLLVPSVTAADGHAEGTPMVILEAQAAGIPVLSTDHSGIAEIVVPGESAKLVPEHDWLAMKEVILDLTSPARRQAMGAVGRAFVEQYHNSRQLNQRLLECYETVRSQLGRI